MRLLGLVLRRAVNVLCSALRGFTWDWFTCQSPLTPCSDTAYSSTPTSPAGRRHVFPKFPSPSYAAGLLTPLLVAFRIHLHARTCLRAYCAVRAFCASAAILFDLRTPPLFTGSQSQFCDSPNRHTYLSQRSLNAVWRTRTVSCCDISERRDIFGRGKAYVTRGTTALYRFLPPSLCLFHHTTSSLVPCLFIPQRCLTACLTCSWFFHPHPTVPFGSFTHLTSYGCPHHTFLSHRACRAACCVPACARITTTTTPHLPLPLALPLPASTFTRQPFCLRAFHQILYHFAWLLAACRILRCHLAHCVHILYYLVLCL